MMLIKILDYVDDPNGFKLGHVDIRVETNDGAYLVGNIAHLKKGDSEWFAFPARKNKQGQYTPTFQYPTPEENRKFLDAVKEEYKHFVGGVKEEIVTDTDLPF